MIDTIIGIAFTPNNIPFIPLNRYSPTSAPTILRSINIAKSPDKIPRGTPNKSELALLHVLHFVLFVFL